MSSSMPIAQFPNSDCLAAWVHLCWDMWECDALGCRLFCVVCFIIHRFIAEEQQVDWATCCSFTGKSSIANLWCWDMIVFIDIRPRGAWLADVKKSFVALAHLFIRFLLRISHAPDVDPPSSRFTCVKMIKKKSTKENERFYIHAWPRFKARDKRTMYVCWILFSFFNLYYWGFCTIVKPMYLDMSHLPFSNQSSSICLWGWWTFAWTMTDKSAIRFYKQ